MREHKSRISEKRKAIILQPALETSDPFESTRKLHVSVRGNSIARATERLRLSGLGHREPRNHGEVIRGHGRGTPLPDTISNSKSRIRYDICDRSPSSTDRPSQSGFEQRFPRLRCEEKFGQPRPESPTPYHYRQYYTR